LGFEEYITVQKKLEFGHVILQQRVKFLWAQSNDSLYFNLLLDANSLPEVRETRDNGYM
jgi:hypothetical protein